MGGGLEVVILAAVFVRFHTLCYSSSEGSSERLRLDNAISTKLSIFFR